MPIDFSQRLRDLLDSIEKDEELLKDFEDALRLEDDPRRKVRYQKNIEQLRGSAAQHRREYEALQKQGSGEHSAEMSVVASHLQKMDTKLSLVIGGQVAIYRDLDDMKQTLISHYDATEQSLIASITQQLNQTQLVLTQTLLDALETNQLSESEMQEILVILDKKIPTLTTSRSEIASIIKDPGLDAKHKLKVSIPIIPFFLDYEGELELGTGFNITTAWKQIKTKLRGE